MTDSTENNETSAISHGTELPRSPDNRLEVNQVIPVDSRGSHEDSNTPELENPVVPKKWWWQRPTIRQLKRNIQDQGTHSNVFDDQWNVDTRLPSEETVKLGGITLVEAFTPATVSKLYDALRKWQKRSNEPQTNFVNEVEQRRVSGNGGWINLGYVRHPGDWVTPWNGFTDSKLPSSVEAVWLKLTFLIPSVAFVCATFTIRDEPSDLSDILRTDFHHEVRKLHLIPSGHLSSIRARIPFSRPKGFRTNSQMSNAIFGKQEAVEGRINGIEASCLDWFRGQFRGRIAEADGSVRPTVRMILTDVSTPFEGHEMWRDVANLDWGLDVYRSTNIKGWSLKGNSRISRVHPFTTTIAARRSDVGSVDEVDSRGQSNWSLTQRFNDEHAGLVVRFALRALLEIYMSRLAMLRDKAGVRTKFRHPVSEARELEQYLLRDGLDVATITADVAKLTKNLMSFRWDVPEYLEDQGDFGKRSKRESIELVPTLCSTLRQMASELSSDTSHTESNIRASAELRQSISNTRLQRLIVMFALAALVASIIGLIVG